MYNIIKIVLISLLVIGCGGGSGGSSSNTPESKGSSLGLAILALLNENFPVEEALEILRKSRVPSFSFLTEAFGNNPSNFVYLTQSLLDKGQSPEVTIYTLCGPCRQPRRDGSLVDFHPELDISALNRLILSSPSLQQDYSDWLLNFVRPLVYRFPQIKFTIIPELEDNQTDESFQKLLSISQAVFADLSNVSYQRNAVDNIVTRTYGDQVLSLEIHTNNTSNLGQLSPGDAISFDGANFSFPGESKACPSADFESVKSLIIESISKDIDVFLWRAEWQGLSDCNLFSAPSPDQRNYQFQSVEDLKELMRLR